MAPGSSINRRKRPQPSYSTSHATTNTNPLTIAQFEESLLALCPNVKFTRGAVEALRCVQEDFVQWVAVATVTAADELDEVKTTKANNNKVPAIKQQDIIDALHRDTAPSSILPSIADQAQEIFEQRNIKDDSNVAAIPSASLSASQPKRKAKKGRQGRPVFSKEMEAAQEQLLQGSRQKMTGNKP